MRWTSEISERGVRDRGFTLECEGRTVPGAVWTPAEGAGPRPLVLLGHGGGLHKRADYIVALARRLVRHHGFAAAAIDGPDHGDRRPDGGLDFEKVWAERLSRRAAPRPEAAGELTADWLATVAALQALPEVGGGPLGYWGLSMGTLYGVPLVASEPRVEVAVLGLMGIPPEDADEAWLVQLRAQMLGDAPKIACPVFLIAQADDELVPLENVLRLFAAIASRDKRLHLNPGLHSAFPAEEIDYSEAFLAKHLAPAGGK
jgi:dienelactone hydrolase